MRVLASLFWLFLAGCATQPAAPVQTIATHEVSTHSAITTLTTTADPSGSDRLRPCQDEKRRLEIALRDAQKRNDELQKRHDDIQNKLDALMAIERDVRNRQKSR